MWTGRHMLVWGGFDSTAHADGALYNRTADSWAVVAGDPLSAREHHAMVWTGQQLLIRGGQAPAPSWPTARCSR